MELSELTTDPALIPPSRKSPAGLLARMLSGSWGEQVSLWEMNDTGTGEGQECYHIITHKQLNQHYFRPLLISLPDPRT